MPGSFSIKDGVAKHLQSLKFAGEEQASTSLNAPSLRLLGSGPEGKLVSEVLCANVRRENPSEGPFLQCANAGSLICSHCLITKYCSPECQKQHWKKHRPTCQSAYLDPDWEPKWFLQKRSPQFCVGDRQIDTSAQLLGNYRVKLWNDVPAIDGLNLSQNEGKDALEKDFKLCYADSEDIRNLLQTVNSLPEDYSGNIEILLHNLNAICSNHNFVILYVLLCSDLDLDSAAELATHLMYSAALTTPMAIAFYQCIESIYASFTSGNDKPWENMDRTWDATFPAANGGKGVLRTTQSDFVVKRSMDMFFSDYKLKAALRKMNNVMQEATRSDYVDLFAVPLEPAHRVSIEVFRKRAILLPFGMDVAHFTEPNRTMFGAEGEWFTRHSANPLFGWDLEAVRKSGKAHGAIPTDIYGCLFFHVKDELAKFASRGRKFNLGVTVSSTATKTLVTRISEGKVVPFGVGCFDRIDLGQLIDAPEKSSPEFLKNWAPLLNKSNPHASILVYFREWQQKEPQAVPDNAPGNVKTELLVKTSAFLGIDMKKIASEGSNSPSFYNVLYSLGAFYDVERPFRSHLLKMNMHLYEAQAGLNLRKKNRIQPKRLGLSLADEKLKPPELTKKEFYDLFLIGSADPLLLFAEYELA